MDEMVMERMAKEFITGSYPFFTEQRHSFFSVSSTLINVDEKRSSVTYRRVKRVRPCSAR